MAIPRFQQAAVYRGPGDVRLEEVPVPDLEEGEVLVRVRACGVCGTDVKKVALGLHAPPRIYGHETAGRIVATRGDVGEHFVGERVALYHHVPDRDSWYGRRGLYAQCPQYRRTGVTAGFEPAGGGYAEYVRVLPWIVAGGGLTRLASGASYEQAAFVEPVNTALKAVRLAGIAEGDLVAVVGLGPIGLILLQLAEREGADVVGSDLLESRRRRALFFGPGADFVDPARQDLGETCRARTQGRGADHALVAAPGAEAVRAAQAALRPGGTLVLFANTHPGEEAALDLGDLCTREIRVLGSYSASVDLAPEAARVVFDEQIDVRSLITHRLPLERTADAIVLASAPHDLVCKVMVVQEEADGA